MAVLTMAIPTLCQNSTASTNENGGSAVSKMRTALKEIEEIEEIEEDEEEQPGQQDEEGAERKVGGVGEKGEATEAAEADEVAEADEEVLQPGELPTSLLERLSAAAAELLASIQSAHALSRKQPTRAKAEAEAEAEVEAEAVAEAEDDNGMDLPSMVGLLVSTLSAMWSLLAYSFTAGRIMQ